MANSALLQSVTDASSAHRRFQDLEPAISANTARLYPWSSLPRTAVTFPAVAPVPNYTAW